MTPCESGPRAAYAQILLERLKAGDAEAATFIGVPLETLQQHKTGLDEATMAMLDPLLQTAATVQALNEAWIVIAILTACAMLCLPFARGVVRAD